MRHQRTRFDEADAIRMDRTAVEIFAPIYPVIARQIVQRLGITRGRCLEIGSGPGLLALALAPLTDLRMILLDSAMSMHMKAKTHLSVSAHKKRFRLLLGDVHHIPLRSHSVDLAVSRGSVFFWKHPEHAFREIQRVLTSSGKAYVGGGFGNAGLRDSISEKMAAIQPGWRAFRNRNFSEDTRRTFVSALEAATVDYDTIRDDSGFWIVISKERQA